MTTTQKPAPAREPIVDALRALALAGVFIVNAVGYAQAPDHPLPLGGPLPADAVGAQWLHGLLVALVQAKAWPFLCFLFGYSLCSVAQQARARGLGVDRVLGTRYRRLLCIGVLHGTLVFFGDILTAYAVCGLVAGGWSLLRPARLLRIWRRLGLLVLALMAFNAVMLWLGRGTALPVGEMTGALVAAHGMGAFLRLNAGSYVDAQIGTLISIFPMLLWLTVAGMLARRFRLLGTRRSARLFWARRFGPASLAGALLVNGVIAAVGSWCLQAGLATDVALSALYSAGLLPGVWLLAAALGTVLHALQRDAGVGVPRWVRFLAPAGRHTLAMYLLLSMALVASRHALPAVLERTVPALVAALLLWCVAIVCARQASHWGMRDPLARWLSRPARATLASPVVLTAPPARCGDDRKEHSA